MSNRSQLATKPSEGGQKVIGNAPVGPREFDPGQWGQIALTRKMETQPLHENFNNVKKELYEKYGYQISESGLLEGRIRDTVSNKESFARPELLLKSFRTGEIRKWLIAVPLTEDMPSRENFPKYIGHLASVNDVLMQIADYQNWFNHMKNMRKRSRRAQVPGSAEFAKAKAKETLREHELLSATPPWAMIQI